MSGLGQKAKFDGLRSIGADSFTGSLQLFSTPLTVVPRLMIFQNDTNQLVGITDSVDTGVGLILQPNERVILDMDSNKDGKHFQFGFSIGTQFHVIGSAGTGTFKLSIIYAESTNP